MLGLLGILDALLGSFCPVNLLTAKSGKEVAFMPTAAWVALVVIILIAIGGYLYYAKKNKKWPF